MDAVAFNRQFDVIFPFINLIPLLSRYFTTYCISNESFGFLSFQSLFYPSRESAHKAEKNGFKAPDVLKNSKKMGKFWKFD